MPSQKYTKAKAAANKRWKEKQDTFAIWAPAGTKDTIKAHVEHTNESMTAFILRAIRETIERDNAKKGPEH